MAYSKNFDKVKLYYESGLWGLDRVTNAVGKWITAEEFEEITAQPVNSESIQLSKSQEYLGYLADLGVDTSGA